MVRNLADLATKLLYVSVKTCAKFKWNVDIIVEANAIFLSPRGHLKPLGLTYLVMITLNAKKNALGQETVVINATLCVINVRIFRNHVMLMLLRF